MPTVSDARVAVSWATPSKSGTPDYQPEVSSGAMLPKVLLRDNETLIMIGILASAELPIAPHAIAPIVAGAFTRLLIANTGLMTPYAVIAGHTIAILSNWHSFSQPFRVRYLFDTVDWLERRNDAYQYDWEHEVHTGYSPFDPTGILPHTIDYLIYNMGAGLMTGTALYWLKDIVLGTEIPQTKEVRCTTCQSHHEVPRQAGRVICPVCGALTTYLPNLFGSEVYRVSNNPHKMEYQGNPNKVKKRAKKEHLDKLKKDGRIQ